MTNYILNGKNPEPCNDLEVWSEWFSHIDNRIVARDGFAGGNNVMISTVFLGVDRAFGLSSTPVLFETMIFSDDNEFSGYQERYSTWDEAVAGHARAVAHVGDRPHR